MSDADVSSSPEAQHANSGRTSDLYRVKAASGRHAVPGSVAAYVVTGAYVSGWTAWCWRLMESLFPLGSFSDHMIIVELASPTPVQTAVLGPWSLPEDLAVVAKTGMVPNSGIFKAALGTVCRWC